MSIDITLIKESFEIAKPIGGQIINRFFENLYHDYPIVKETYFQDESILLKESFLNFLINIVDYLDKPDLLSIYLQKISQNLISYKIDANYFDYGTNSILKTFSQFFGRSWNEKLSKEWTEVFQFISQTLKSCSQIKIEKSQEDVQKNPVQVNNSIKVEIPFLTDDFKKYIQNAVKSVILKQLKIEVQKTLQEEMLEIETMKPEELIERALRN